MISRIMIMGAGNVATHLSKVLSDKGYIITQIYSRTLERAKDLAKYYNAAYTDNIDEVNTDSDLYILVIKDDAIGLVADKLRLPGKMVVHTSGSVPMQALSPVSNKIGIIYPLQTFSKDRPAHWLHVPICLEANDKEVYRELENLARHISSSVHAISSEQRKWLHLAAVFAANFGNHMLHLAKNILDEKNLPYTWLEPLMQETVSKAFDMGPAASQTGPARRNDENTMITHQGMLANDPVAMDVYKVLSESIKRLQENQ